MCPRSRSSPSIQRRAGSRKGKPPPCSRLDKRARRSLPKKSPWTRKLQQGRLHQTSCWRTGLQGRLSAQAQSKPSCLPSASHLLGAAGHPALSLPSTQVFIKLMSSTAHRLHPQGVLGSGHRAMVTSSTEQAAAILALY